MATEIKVPTLGESVTEATIGQWFKKEGDSVQADEPLVELETDKVTIEVPAPSSGKLSSIAVKEGETVEVGALLGLLSEGAGGTAGTVNAGPEQPVERPAAKEAEPAKPVATSPAPATANGPAHTDMPPAPSARKLMEEQNVSADQVSGSGKRGQVLKGDVLSALQNLSSATPASAPAQARAPSPAADEPREQRVKMTKLRQTIARRLKDAQANAAMLTTFNDVDMGAVMELRKQYKDLFEKKHGTRLGFMGFFVKAVCAALKEVPAVNAELDGQDLIYKNYYHIGVAVGTDKGLVVPVVRDAQDLSIAGVEKTISNFGKKARDGQLTMADMQGGTFTISNGGVYGSLMSTPILNAPQSGILGMHRIEERPVVRNGQVVIRPMMYLALSYDHRVIDGKEAVTFLVRIKDAIEDPQRLVLDL
ncbi:2-oxoglutarate dehydrogenase E2 component [Faunimonas pinastri]|uniref:Dihydrolipoyllysine-residue succinyltransferase component of 2-oxoglutarate dehydrogenase complex n=1 Tax=Faunimonas pinastri TaxID=1855383 RepID=A0A1H9JC02_9HYPH|nr:2-oxoglutarate dehydrogenase complex dihydrolipoyllysine-residue succinyltransferase [Faunimonas pinastri]SEQ84297.1 2-oxoglutarate dehydrogenase E2 component [Faunimonas pinastri]